MPSPLVSIVVVNYNGQEHLAECLAALTADSSVPAEVVVVDNASIDQSLAILGAFQAQAPGLTVLSSAANLGYAGGVNLALPRLAGKYLAILNSDVIVVAGWLAPIVAWLDIHPETGLVNPLVLLDADPGTINSAGQNIHVTGLGFNRWLGHPRQRAGSAPVPVSGIHGSAFVIRREILERAGGWDAGGFLYHEDVELSWLLQLMGYDLYCLPAACVRHKYHLTMYPEKLYLLERNRVAMLLTHLRWRSWLLLAPWLLFTELLMWGYCGLRGLRFLRAKAASYLWLARQRPALRQNRRRIQALRRRTDADILRRLRWRYDWDQFLTLGRERGPSARQPKGRLPVNVSDSRQ
jgi:GT2 family glycosyltransferase